RDGSAPPSAPHSGDLRTRRLRSSTVSGRWQAKEKAGASLYIFSPEFAAVSFHDRADNGQTHPHSVWFGGKEMRENLFRICLRKTDSVITDTDLDKSIVRGGGNHNTALRKGRLLHRLDRI